MNIIHKAIRLIRSSVAALATLAVVASVTTPVQAEYPEKPINVLVGFGAGGGVDTFARVFAANAMDEIGVPLVVVNKPGAASAVAAKQAMKARPDGYTLFVTNASSLEAKIIQLGDKAGMNLDADFKTLGSVGQLVTGLLVPEDSPFKSAKDLVDYAKANPGKLRWSHPGRGSLHMLGGAVFLADNGIEAQDVPFKGGGKARNAVAASQVDFGFMGVQLVGGFEGKVRAIGVTSANRDTIFKSVPTFAEQGLAQMNLSGPITVYAPAGIDPAVEAKLMAVVEMVAQSDKFMSMATESGLSAEYLSKADTVAIVKSVSDKVRPILDELAASK